MNPIRCYLSFSLAISTTTALFTQAISAPKTEKRWYHITQVEALMYKPRREYHDWNGGWGFHHTVGYVFKDRLNPSIGLGTGIEWWHFDNSDDRAFNPRFPFFTELRLTIPTDQFQLGIVCGLGYAFWRRNDYLKRVGVPPGGQIVSLNGYARFGRHFYEKIGIRLQEVYHVEARHFTHDTAKKRFITNFSLAIGYWW